MTRYYLRKSIRKWAFLEPWCAFLREHAALQLLTDHKNDLMLCVRMRPEPREPLSAYLERVVRLREALELLTMLVYIDPVAWQALLRYKCKCLKSPFWDDWTLPLGMWLKLGDSKNPEFAGEAHDTKFYRAFFTAFGQRGQGADGGVSDTVRFAMQSILSEMTPEMHRELNKHAKVEVCLRFIPSRSLEPERVNAYLEDVVSTVKQCLAISAAAENPEDPSSQYVSKLSLNDVELHIGRIELCKGATATLADFMALETQTVGFYPLLDFAMDSALGRLPISEIEPLLQAMASRVSSTNKRLGNSGGGGDCSRTSLPPIESFAHIGKKTFVGSSEGSHSYARRFKALFSALGGSQCFDELHLDSAIANLANGTRGKKWQWLTYALFSKDSTARVTKVTLSELDFYQADMNAIVSILNTRNPASKLGGLCRTARDHELLEDRPYVPQPGDDEPYDSDAEIGDDEEDVAGPDDEDPDVRAYFSEDSESYVGDAKSPQSVLVQKGTTVEIDPFNRESKTNQRESFELKGDTSCRVIEDDSGNDWVGILVPCFGYCTTPRESIVRYESNEEASDNETSLSWGYRGSIKSLRLALGVDVDVTRFLPLLKYLGSTLVSLETSPEVTVDRQSLRQVFEACPHLKVLRISEPRSDEIEPELIAGYAHGRCSITELRFDCFTASLETMNFMSVLQNPASRAAQTLQKLSLFADSDNALDERILTAILDILAGNTVLELLQLEIHSEQMKKFKPLFMKYHGQIVSGVGKVFPVECRVAFLSVVRFFSSVDESPARKRARTQSPICRSAEMEKLDRGVASLIFEFAANRKTRRIRLYEVDPQVV